MAGTELARFERLYHFHIRKTAGTSVNQAILQSLFGGNQAYERLVLAPGNRIKGPRGDVVGWKTGNLGPTFFFAFSHLPNHKVVLPEQTFSFSFFRDPVERVLSLYRMLLDRRNSGVKGFGWWRQFRWLGNKFGDFLDNAPQTVLENQLYIFDRDLHVGRALNEVRRLDFFGNVATHGSDFATAVKSEFGLELEIGRVHRSESEPEIQAKELERLHARLANEIRFLERVREEVGFGSSSFS